jgi:hypothetical protein
VIAKEELKTDTDSPPMPLANSLVILDGKEFIVFDYIKKEW